MITPTAIAETIGTAWAQFLTAGQSAPTPHDAVYASAYRRCDRRMVYELTQPQTLPPWPPETLARFRRGEDRERDLLADLMRMGRDASPRFSVIGQQQRFQLRDHKGRLAISGRVDARIEIDRVSAPIEIKAWSPFIVDRIETFADLFDVPWTTAGAYQLLAYLFGAGEPFGFLLLDRSGIPKLLPVELEPNLDRMEEFLQKAERALDAVAAGELPPFLDDDPSECQRCPWYGHTCNPPLSSPGTRILSDPELEAAINRRQELKAAADEYRDLDDDIKARLRGIESAVIGPFTIAG